MRCPYFNCEKGADYTAFKDHDEMIEHLHVEHGLPRTGPMEEEGTERADFRRLMELTQTVVDDENWDQTLTEDETARTELLEHLDACQALYGRTWVPRKRRRE